MATRTTAKRDEATGSLSAEERAAMKERAAEVRRAKKGAKAEDDLRAVLDKIADLEGEERDLVTRLHEVITGTAPQLAPRTWYGMPAYAQDGKVLCFVQPASKFDSRYTTLGFNDTAALDDGTMWPTTFAVTRLTKADEERVADLVRRATT